MTRTRRRCGIAALVIGAILVMGVGITAQESAPAQPKEPKPDAPAIQATFKDGLEVSSADGNFKAHIGGRILVHYRSISDRPEDASATPRTLADAAFLRMARLEMYGTFYKDFEFRITLDTPTSTTASTATGTLQDCYVGWRGCPEFGVRVGQMKVPFSLEELITRKTLDFNERSVINRLSHSRDIGMTVGGTLFGGLLEYEGGGFNGQGRALLDGNDEKDVALRLRTRPFAWLDDAPWLKGLCLGVAGTIGDLDNASTSGTSNALDFYTTELNVLFLDATAGTLDGKRTRQGLELAWTYGPLGVRAEFIQRNDSVDAAAADDEKIRCRGYYVDATWLLTGEAKSFEKAIAPENRFNPGEGGWGAVELGVRFARLHVDPRIFELGIASSASNSNGVSVVTAGVTWYLTRNIRVAPNVIWEKFDDEVAFTSRSEDSLWGFLIKTQLDF